MAVSRNDNVSSALSRLDSRLNTVENKTLGLSGLSSGVATTAPADTGGSSVTPGPGITPPKTYTKIIKAYIYGDQTTGAGSRIELYFATPLKTSISLDAGNNEVVTPLAPGETMRVQGLHSTSADDFVISPKDFIVQATDTPPWDDADLRLLSTGEVGPGQLRRSWRNTPSTGNNKPSDATAGETVEFTTWFNPVLAVPKTYTGATELITTRRIDSVSATGSTVTVTLNSTNKFKVGDVIYIDQLSASAPASTLFGIDGLFKVTATPTSTSIQYELDAPLASPITNFVPATYKYVYPVAQPKVEEGEVWIDKSVEPNKVFVWKELRWYDTADPIGQVTPEQDGIAPSPVTDLAATTELPAGSTSPVINLTWTPPTTRSNGDSISGFLDGYDIWYKRSTEAVWKKEFVKDGGQGIAAHQIKDAVLLQNFTYNIRVYAVDIMGQYSTAATVNVLTAKYSETLNAPSTPTVSSKLGTITVTWDGLDSTGNLPVPGVLYIEFHESTTSGFTPGAGTLVETTPITNGGNYIVLTERLFDDTTFYYYKTRFVRQISPTETETSAASTQSAGQKVVGVTGPDIVAGSVTTNKLEAGFVTASLVRGDIIRAGTVGANTRVELKTSGIYAFNAANDPVLSFDTSTATLTIGGYATNSNVSAVSTIATTANTTANTANTTANSASTTASTALSTANSKLDPANVIAEINARYTSSGSSTTTTIAGGAIRTGTLDGDRVTATTAIIFTDGSYSSVIGNGVVTGIPLTTVGMSLRAGASTQRGFLSLYQDGNGVIVGRDTGNRIAFFDSGGSYMDVSSTTVNISGSSQVTLGNSLTRVLNNFRVELGASSTNFDVFLDFSAATRAFRITQSGFTFVGNPNNSSSTVTMYVYGRANALGIFADNQAAPSSIRMKTDIRNFDVSDSLLNMTPKLFKYINSVKYESWEEKPNVPEISEDRLGLIAEDFVEAGLEYLVSRNSAGEVDGLDYSRISVLLIPLIKKLKDRVDALEGAL